MLYVVDWEFKPEHRNAVIARFKQTGGLPPKGVKLLGRWHGIGNNKGVFVAESDNPLAFAKWMLEWSDLASFDVYPALVDEEIAKVLP
jgi:hypothetical protein